MLTLPKPATGPDNCATVSAGGAPVTAVQLEGLSQLFLPAGVGLRISIPTSE